MFGLWFMVFLNFWLMVIPVERFLARGGSWWLVVARGGSWWLVVGRGNECFGSWWLVVARGRSWWLVVACGGLWWLVCCFRNDLLARLVSRNETMHVCR